MIFSAEGCRNQVTVSEIKCYTSQNICNIQTSRPRLYLNHTECVAIQARDARGQVLSDCPVLKYVDGFLIEAAALGGRFAMHLFWRFHAKA